ncbi:hypothetical protein [Brevundimonas goettingensis]|uniref:DUF2927 domain-containing protein n=1 Tax=Brevundimonas goettingensis TaxID=2774190 RepID=A0A975C5V8_9CAUL|nr:hypothetical protein [Brevundimonas goettingensis]QTC92535.1 hypothetical protein IFJ75_06605 [Brevundimonas goettingensis]
MVGGLSAWAMLGLAALTLQTAPVPQSRQTPTEPPASPVDDVEVVAGALPEAVRAFVDEVAAPVNQRGIARWNSIKVCIGAVNMRREAAQTLIDHVSTVAFDYGIETGEPGCKPNVLVIGAADGAVMADGLAAARPRAFRIGASRIDQGPAAFERFRTSDAPVRWWQISMPTDSWTGNPVVRMPGQRPPRIEIFAKSQMRGRIRDDLKRVIVIVDFNSANGMTFDQLGDYIAMVAFAQIDPEADTSEFQTVLNLFDRPAAERAGAGGLTDWDRAYLSTLYDYRNERILPFRQAELMTTALRPDADQPNADPSEP